MSRLDSVGLARQTAKGTKNTTMAYFPPVNSADVDINQETIELEESLGHRFPTPLAPGTAYFALPLNGAARPTSLPRILSAYFGNPVTTNLGGTPVAYSHMFDPAAVANPEWLSVLVNRTDPTVAITDLLYDLRGNELTLSVEPNGFLMFEAALIALQNDNTQPEPTVTRDSSTRWTFDMVTAYINVAGGGEVAMPCSAFSVNYNNNLVTDLAVLGSRLLYDLPTGNADGEVTFTTTSLLSTHYRRALLTTPEVCAIRLLAEGATISGTNKLTLEVVIPACEYVSAPAGVSAEDPLVGIEVTARPRYDEATSKFMTMKVINTVASYAT